VACGEQHTAIPDIPPALQEPTVADEVTSSLSRGKYGTDLVNALFDDVLESDTALRALMKALRTQQLSHEERTRAFHLYEMQNDQYYASALVHAGKLTDTLERADQVLVLAESERRYDSGMTKRRALIEEYARSSARTEDLVELVKLQRTLALMESYQRTARPDSSLLQDELQRIRSMEQRLRASLKL